MLLECLTHRRRGHYEGDSEAYRDPLAEEEWRQRDPLIRLQEQMITDGWIDEADARELEMQAEAAVNAAVEFARASPFPDSPTAAEFAYAAAEDAAA
jgi:pyruvate dehydrogenase E1 component alpha subunit